MKISEKILKEIIEEELQNLIEKAPYKQIGTNKNDGYILHGKDIPVEEDKEGKMAQGQLNRTVELASMLKKEFDVNTDLPEWVESKITKAEDYLSTVFDYMRGKEGLDELGSFSHDSYLDIGQDSGLDTKKGKSAVKNWYQGYSSKEAKNIIDKQLKFWAKDLRKTQYRVIKDWMKAAKSGAIDYFDLVRGLKTGDIRRAHPYETDFLHKVLTRDKIIDRFRQYFGGKKGKRGRRK